VIDVPVTDVAVGPRKDWETVVKSVLDPLTHAMVLGWKTSDINEKFLRPLGLERLRYIFEAHNITGRSL
jgi:hypothetical protein